MVTDYLLYVRPEEAVNENILLQMVKYYPFLIGI